MFRKKTKVYKHENLTKQLQELKVNHIRKLSGIIPETKERMYVCSGNKLEIEINFDRYDFMKLDSNGLYFGAFNHNRLSNKDYIEKNIKILLFFISEINTIKNKNLSETVYYVSNYDYKNTIKMYQKESD